MSGRAHLMLASFVAMIVLCATNAAPAAAGLVGYWNFDGCSTTDASGQGANLTAVGVPACGSGRFGTAWALDGTSQYLERASDAAFAPGTRSWSVAAWAKIAVAPGFAVIVSWYRCGANPGCSSPDAALYSLALSNSHPYWDVRDDAASDLAVEDTLSNLADHQWHFLVGTMNPTTDSLKLYVDGALRGTRQGPIGTLSTGGIPIPLEVGRWFRTGWGTPDYYFPGAIDEVRIFDNELSAATVAALFSSNSTTAVSFAEERGFSIEAPSPNPTRGNRFSVAFTLPAAEPAHIGLFDVAGRVVSERSIGALGAGRHLVDLTAGRRLAPGIYLIELRQGTRSLTRRVTVLR